MRVSLKCNGSDRDRMPKDGQPCGKWKWMDRYWRKKKLHVQNMMI